MTEPAFLVAAASFLPGRRNFPAAAGSFRDSAAKGRGRDMVGEKRRDQPARSHGDADAPKPHPDESRKAGSQGIVRDQRGQEQPVDKDRAQQTSKNE
jgi:hypothetical protein